MLLIKFHFDCEADAKAEVTKRAHALLLAKVHEEAEPVLKKIQLRLSKRVR